MPTKASLVVASIKEAFQSLKRADDNKTNYDPQNNMTTAETEHYIKTRLDKLPTSSSEEYQARLSVSSAKRFNRTLKGV